MYRSELRSTFELVLVQEQLHELNEGVLLSARGVMNFEGMGMMKRSAAMATYFYIFL